ncbi:MAG TPA: hypothetical protein VF499_15030 [Afipia sp.]
MKPIYAATKLIDGLALLNPQFERDESSRKIFTPSRLNPVRGWPRD